MSPPRPGIFRTWKELGRWGLSLAAVSLLWVLILLAAFALGEALTGAA